jgi:uroporphyrinogen decarboxylase
MTSKERFLKALNRETPDRLPVTTHHLQPFFMDKYMNGMSNDEFFDEMGMDPISWFQAYKPDESKGEYYDPEHEPGYLEARRISTDEWRVKAEDVPGLQYPTVRYSFVTPEKTLTMNLQSNEYTSWVSERLIKEKSDIEIIAKYAVHKKCDVEAVNKEAERYGDRGMVRGLISFFDVYGQSGCWQDAAVLFGIEQLIMATFEDPDWVHEFLKILFEQKKTFLESCKGAKYDLLEGGGGDASSTVISPDIFENFVAPYDAKINEIAHDAGQKVVYHTCGGMTPIYEMIADMNPDAMETFTPRDMGGDTDLAEAKKIVGDRVCMIGGFDQFHFFKDCSPEETRKEVRRCFEAAGEGGGYILCPSDHFFDADPELVRAFADEARKCQY